MGFEDDIRALLKRRTPLSNIVGFAGGNLQDALDRNGGQQPQPEPQKFLQSAQQPQVPQPDTSAQTRPRMVTPDALRQPDTSTRLRVADVIGMDRDRLLEAQSRKESKKSIAGNILLNALAGAGAGLGHRQITPIQSGKQRDIGQAQERLGMDMELQNQQIRKQSAQSQADAREAAIFANQTRQEQQDRGLGIREDALKQKQARDYHADLIRVYNGQTDFDPSDPNNADFVAEWTKAFGYTPKKNIRGSQMAVIQGYRPDGSPIVSILNKGAGTATEATGDLPSQTEGQANRKSQEGRTAATIAAADERQRRAIAARPIGKSGVSPATANRAAKLQGQIKSAETRLSQLDAFLGKTPDPATQVERNKTAAALEGYKTELDSLDRPQQGGSGKSWSQGKWKAANPNGDVNAAIKAAQAKGYRVVQ